MEKLTFTNDFSYVEKVIKSCNKYEQLLNSYIWSCDILKRKYPNEFIEKDLSTKLFYIAEAKTMELRYGHKYKLY